MLPVTATHSCEVEQCSTFLILVSTCVVIFNGSIFTMMLVDNRYSIKGYNDNVVVVIESVVV